MQYSPSETAFLFLLCQRCFYTHSTTEIAQSFGLSRHQLRYRCLNSYQITPRVLIRALCLHHFIRLSADDELKTQRNRFIRNHARMYLWRLTRDVFGYCPSELEDRCHGFSKHTESSNLSWMESDLENEELVFLKSHHLLLITNVLPPTASEPKCVVNGLRGKMNVGGQILKGASPDFVVGAWKFEA